LSALFAANGQAWGTRELIVSLASDMVCNVFGSDVIGRTIEPLLRRRRAAGGLRFAAASGAADRHQHQGTVGVGKEHLRPLQKKLAGDIGVSWSDFALISPDIWRKQLLDYGALGAGV
jgi:hypothetical protein